MDRPDAELRQDIGNALSRDVRVDADPIDVDIDGGSVFLKGTATTLYDKRIISEIVGRIKGVRGVVNEVQVTPTVKRPDGEAAAKLEAAQARDLWLEDNLNAYLPLLLGDQTLGRGSADATTTEKRPQDRGVRR